MLGFKILNSNIFGGFQKNDFFFGGGGGGKKILWIFFGSPQNLPILRGHFYAFKGLFLREKYRMGDIFWAAKISNVF